MHVIRPKRKESHYYLYILTNKARSLLEVSTTGDWKGKLREWEYLMFNKSFIEDTCHILLYWETFDNALAAVEREEEIRGWSRRKKHDWIDRHNPNWKPLNHNY